jgi:hypothetical protein
VLVPFETTRKSYNKEVLESRIFVRSTSTGVEYVLYDIINPSKQHVAKSKEEFTKENGIIDRILKSSNDLLSSQVAGIKKDFESIHAQAEIDPDKISFLDS